MINELEKKLEELFKSQGLEKCVERWKSTTKYVTKTEEETQKYCKEVPEIDGYYFWNPVRGGLSVIINHRGERLIATSSVSFNEHLKAFKEGKRN